MKQNWNIQRGGGGVHTKEHSVGQGVWIFSGATQSVTKEEANRVAMDTFHLNYVFCFGL